MLMRLYITCIFIHSTIKRKELRKWSKNTFSILSRFSQQQFFVIMVAESNKFKLSKLYKSLNYMQWKRHVNAYHIKEYFTWVSLTGHLDGDENDFSQAWEEGSTKTKSIIIIKLCDANMTKTRAIIDDDKNSTKELTNNSTTFTTRPTKWSVTLSIFFTRCSSMRIRKTGIAFFPRSWL